MKPNTPALFLDRDGVINKNHGYVFEIENFEFFPEIFDICIIAAAAEMPIVIVTNQSGIGRGYFSESEYQKLTHWMVSQFETRGITINEVFYASENPEAPLETNTSRRKPSPAMILEAAEKLELDLQNSIMLGDNETDMISAHRAGIGHRVLVGKPKDSTVASNWGLTHQECLEIIRKIVSEIRSD